MNQLLIYHNIKDNEINICLDNLKVDALHYANELLGRVRLSFQKLSQTRLIMERQYEKNVGETSNDT